MVNGLFFDEIFPITLVFDRYRISLKERSQDTYLKILHI